MNIIQEQESRLVSKQFKGLQLLYDIKNPKRMAFAVISIALQNVVSLNLLIAFKILDMLLHLYLVITMILQLCVSQSEVSKINVIESYLAASSSSIAHLIVQSIILGFFLLFIVGMIIIIIKTDSITAHSSLKTLKQTISFMIIAFITFLQIPILEYIGASFLLQNYRDKISNQNSSNEQLQENPSSTYLLVHFAITITNAVLFVILSFLIVRIYTIKLPSNKIFWASSSTQLHAMKVVNKVALVSSHLYFTVMDTSKNGIFVILGLALLFGVVSLMRVMLIPYYNKVIDWLIRLTELLTTCTLFVLIVAHAIAEDWGQVQTSIESKPISSGHLENSSLPLNATRISNITMMTSPNEKPKEPRDFGLCLLISFVIIPGIVGLAYLLDYFRQQHIWKKLEKNKLKNEIEIEHGLYILIQKLQTAIWNNEETESMDAFADLLYLIENHNKNCENVSCPCHRKEIVGYLLNKGHTDHSKTITLENEEVRLLNSQESNKFFKSFDQIDPVRTLTFLQFNDGNQINGCNDILRESFSNNLDEYQILAPLSSKMLDAENLRLGLKFHNQDASEDSNLLVNVNIPSLKASFLNSFAEIYFYEAKRRFPQSKNLFYQYANFTLHCCKNRYMTESLIRNIWSSPLTHADWIEKVSAHVNELYIIMEVEKYPYRQTQQNSSAASNLDENIEAQSDFVNWGVSYFQTKNNHNRHIKESSGMLQHGSNSLEWLQTEQFIQIIDLTEEFNDQVEKLAKLVQYFWKLVQSDLFDVYQAQKAGILMAETIANVYHIFKQIEDASNEGKIGLNNGWNDSRICFTFALMQKYLLNDLVQHDIYIAKMNSQKEMRRLIQNNMLSSSKEGIEETGFVLAKGQMQHFGEIIICNQVFRKQLGYTQADQSHLNIVDFMPTQVKEWHNQFIHDFCKSGGASNVILNNTTFAFMKQKSGYIIPVMMHIKFNYSNHCGTKDENSITFAMFVFFLQEIWLSRSSQHLTKNVMFFLCSDYDGQVLDISESVFKLLKLSQEQISSISQDDLEFNCLKIDELFPSLPSFNREKMQIYQNLNNEQIIDIDIDIVSKINELQNRRRNDNDESYSSLYKASLHIYCEIYGQQSVYMKKRSEIIFAITLLDSNAIKNQVYQKKLRINKEQNFENFNDLQKSQYQGALGQSKENNGEPNSIQMSQISVDIPQDEGQSQSSTSHPSTANSVSESMQLKQLQASTEKTSSRSLKLITYLIFGVFILLIVLSTINLTLSLDRYQNLQHEVNLVRKSYDRVLLRAKLSIDMRGMLIAANGYGSLVMQTRLRRFKEFGEQLQITSLLLKETQEYLDKNIIDYEAGQISLNEKNVILNYIDADNNPFNRNETLSFSMNLMVQRFTEIMYWPMERFAVKIKVMSLFDPPKGYRPNEDERTIHFVVMSAWGNIRAECRRTSLSLRQETERNALKVAQTTQLTIIISIVMIGIVCMIVSPIICRIQERKYMCLRFFLHVEHQHLTMLDQQVSTFLQLAFHQKCIALEQTYSDKKEPIDGDKTSLDKESIDASNISGWDLDNSLTMSIQDQTLGLQSHSLLSQGIHTLRSLKGVRGYKKQQIQEESVKSVKVNDQFILAKGMQEFFDSKSQRIAIQDHDNRMPFHLSDLPSQMKGMTNLENQKEKIDAAREGVVKKEKIIENTKTKKLEMTVTGIQLTQKQKQNSNSDRIVDLDTGSKQFKIENRQPSIVVLDRQSNNSLSKLRDKDEETLSHTSNINAQEFKKDSQSLKYKRIKQVIFKKKIMSAVLILGISFLLSSYFIAVYFLSVLPFQATPSILGYLDQVFMRDYNLGVAIAFTREMYVFNSSMIVVENPYYPAAEYFLSESMRNERDYLSMRKDLPAVFESISGYFDQIETNQSCALAYYDEPEMSKQAAIDKCLGVINGIMQQGVSAAINLLIRHFLKVSMHFSDAQSIQRTYDFIMTELRDANSLALVDLKNYQVDRSLNSLKNKVTIATSDYYQKLIGQYTILFCMFVVSMTVMFIIFMIFGFSRIKDLMWKTNLTLKIMPLDYVPKECLPQLKAFYQY